MKDTDFAKFEEIIGIKFNDQEILKQALTHRSFLNEHKSLKGKHNERLEFLGDAILGSVVAEVLFKKFPYKDEGFLTEMRSKMVIS